MSQLQLVLENNPMGVYSAGDTVTGTLKVNAKEKMQHNGITVSLEGRVTLQLPTKNPGVFETLYNEFKPVDVLSLVQTVGPAGKLSPGVSNLPFSFELKRTALSPLVETYHGVFICVQYFLIAEISKGKFSKNQREQLQILVQNPNQHIPDGVSKPTTFTMTPSTHPVEGKGKAGAAPGKFKIHGNIDKTECELGEAFTGSLVVESSEMKIRSIELHLCRTETCTADMSSKQATAQETTYVQNTQLVSGDVNRNFNVPIHLTFPRLLTCPTLDTNVFKAEFSVNFVVIFEGEMQSEQNFNLSLYRAGGTAKEDMQITRPEKKK